MGIEALMMNALNNLYQDNQKIYTPSEFHRTLPPFKSIKCSSILIITINFEYRIFLKYTILVCIC